MVCEVNSEGSSSEYNSEKLDNKSEKLSENKCKKFDWNRKDGLKNRIESITDKSILYEIYHILKKHEPECIKNGMQNNYGFHIYFQNLKQETYHLINECLKSHEK